LDAVSEAIGGDRGMIEQSLDESLEPTGVELRRYPVPEHAEGRGHSAPRRLLTAVGDSVRTLVRPRSAVAERLQEKARSCRELRAPLFAALLDCASRDVLAGGVCWRVLEGHERDPRGSALPLRFMGSVHRLVLQGRAPELAPYCPSVGGHQPPDEATGPFLRVVEAHVAELRKMIADPVQTNEVGRCGALLGGFLVVARQTSLPLRLLEVGASAGLNLRWDRYRYVGSAASWGCPESPVVLDWDLRGGKPDVDVSPSVVERRGCDLAPVDPRDEEARWRLLSYVWPHHVARRRVLEHALELAPHLPVEVERETASIWLARQLWPPSPGVATVVFHTIVMQFMTRRERRQVQRTIAEAGRRATPQAPLAWLRMEGNQPMKDVLLTMWPGGQERRIASAGLYGRPVYWYAGEERTGRCR
jgi:hypothetical protein